VSTELRIVTLGDRVMLARVARQLRRVSWERSGVSHEMSDSLPLLPTDFLSAHAAIEAMREPTEAMLQAAEREGPDDDVWRAMIDEALR
jgi:hypothetical protein